MIERDAAAEADRVAVEEQPRDRGTEQRARRSDNTSASTSTDTTTPLAPKPIARSVAISRARALTAEYIVFSAAKIAPSPMKMPTATPTSPKISAGLFRLAAIEIVLALDADRQRRIGRERCLELVERRRGSEPHGHAVHGRALIGRQQRGGVRHAGSIHWRRRRSRTRRRRSNGCRAMRPRRRSRRHGTPRERCDRRASPASPAGRGGRRRS